MNDVSWQHAIDKLHSQTRCMCVWEYADSQDEDGDVRMTIYANGHQVAFWVVRAYLVDHLILSFMEGWIEWEVNCNREP